MTDEMSFGKRCYEILRLKHELEFRPNKVQIAIELEKLKVNQALVDLVGIGMEYTIWAHYRPPRPSNVVEMPLRGRKRISYMVMPEVVYRPGYVQEFGYPRTYEANVESFHFEKEPCIVYTAYFAPVNVLYVDTYMLQGTRSLR
jgi:hypothetical protein